MIRVPGADLAIDADAASGTITLYRTTTRPIMVLERLSAQQVEALQALLEQAKHIVETGVGSMTEH